MPKNRLILKIIDIEIGFLIFWKYYRYTLYGVRVYIYYYTVHNRRFLQNRGDGSSGNVPRIAIYYSTTELKYITVIYIISYIITENLG